MGGGSYTRVLLTVLAVLMAVILAQVARPGVPPAAASTPGRPMPADAGAAGHAGDDAWARPVAPRELRGVGLGDAIGQFRAETGVNIIVRWGMLGGRGVTPATPVTASVRGGTLVSALTTVVRAADPAAVAKIGMDEGVITVTAGESPAPLIDIVDLRPALPTFEAPDPRANTPPPTGAGGLFTTAAPPAAAQQLAELMHSVLDRSDDWFAPCPFAGRAVVLGDTPGRAVRARRFVAQFAAEADVGGAGGTTRPAVPDLSLEDVLTDRTPELRLENVSFEQAVDTIRRQWRVNIEVEWAKLKGTIDRDATVNVRLWNVRLSQALSAVLDATAEGDKVNWFARDGFITITGDNGEPRGGIIRVYDVRDLVAEAVTYRKAQPRDRASEPTAPAEDQEGEALVELVRGTLYKSAMGYRFWAGRLIVVDTPEAHRRVEELLAGLRAANSHPPAGPKTMPAATMPGLPRSRFLRRRGQVKGEGRPLADLGLHVDPPLVVLDDFLADGQPQPGPLGLAVAGRAPGGEEGLEDLADVLLRDARAGVDHLEPNLVAGLAVESTTLGRRRLDGDRPAAAAEHGVSGVDEQVEQDLLQLDRVPPDRQPRRDLYT